MLLQNQTKDCKDGLGFCLEPYNSGQMWDNFKGSYYRHETYFGIWNFKNVNSNDNKNTISLV